MPVREDDSAEQAGRRLSRAAAFSAGIVIVIAACLVAAFYPARRAAGVEPWVALRIE
jgi:ABC-type lipoprotein release transport system permease subunit